MATTAQKFAASYTKKGGRNAGSITWQTIIDALMSFLGNCTTPNAAKRWARNHPAAAKEAIENSLKSEGTFSSALDRKAAVEAAYETLLSMSNAEMAQYM